MISALVVAGALAGQAAPEPDPQVWYWQAAACLGSSLVEAPGAETGDDTPEARDRAETLLTWGLMMGHYGPLAGRTREQIETDAAAAEAFFVQVRDHRPQALPAHRAWCEAMGG